MSVSIEPDLAPERPAPVLWEEYQAQAVREWQDLLGSDPAEDRVQSFFEQNPAFLPGVNQYGSGHHSPHGGVLYTQPRLKGLHRDKIPDFMWIGANSARVTPVVIEIERPEKRWFTTRGVLSAEFHQAHGQLSDWRGWFRKPENEIAFRETYLDWIDDFTRRPIVPHYILIYGRRSEFEGDRNGELTGRRHEEQRDHEELMTFDRLAPDRSLSDVVTVHSNSAGNLEVRAIQPCFTTGPLTGELASLCELPDSVLDAVPMWTQERRNYVSGRWSHWAEHHRRKVRAPQSMQTGE